MDEILGYIAEESPGAAEHVLEAIDSMAESLSELSERGRVVPEIGDPSIREVFVFRYRMLYQVGDDQVRVLGVIHGAMDFAARFRPGK
jgi:plasmid stabilization system protein ParE